MSKRRSHQEVMAATPGRLLTEQERDARLPVRVLNRIRVNGAGCWLYAAAPTVGGYVQIGAKGSRVYVHRFVYERVAGPIPDGMEIDHLCRVTNCVRPDHLEPVTPEENKRRARPTHCMRGHELTEENRGRCRTCHRAYMRAYHAARKAAA